MFELLLSSIRLSTPLIFAAMGGLICERSGIATLCLEGVLLIGAFSAAFVNVTTHNPWLAIAFGMACGALVMLLHALMTVYGKADHIVSGVAINIFAAGITPLLNKVAFGSSTSSAQIPAAERLGEWSIPLLSHIPGVGSFFTQIPLIYLAWLLPFALHFMLYKTTWGLHVIASGDGPEALETSGVSVKKVRLGALAVGGMLAALGGVYLSIGHASQFTRDMSAGRGYIALTAVIFGKWKPIPCLFSCLLFGFADALQIELQSRIIFGMQIPVQAIQAFPYVLTLLVLVGFVGKANPPLAIGKKI